jgi:hypothetical protein
VAVACQKYGKPSLGPSERPVIVEGRDLFGRSQARSEGHFEEPRQQWPYTPEALQRRFAGRAIRQQVANCQRIPLCVVRPRAARKEPCEIFGGGMIVHGSATAFRSGELPPRTGKYDTAEWLDGALESGAEKLCRSQER